MLSKENLFLLFFLLLLNPFFGQQPASYNYTTSDGLPSSETYDIIQDKKGYIWIATDRGVSRFDGYSFKNITTSDGLADNTVLSFYEDQNGRIWFHGISGRLCYYEYGTITQYKYNDLLTKDKGRIIRSFECDEHDNVIIGTLGGGIVSISSDGKLTTLTPELPNGKSYLAMISKNKLQLAVVSGFSSNSENSFVISKEGNVLSNRIPGHKSVPLNITGILRKNGNLVVYGGGTVIEVKDTAVQNLNVSFNDILRINEDKDSCLWVSFRSGGVRKYKPNQSFFSTDYQTYLKSESITSIYEDTEKGIWLSTLNSGIFYIPSVHYNTFSFPAKYVLTALYANEKEDEVLLGFSNGLVSKIGTNGPIQTFNFNPGKDSVNHVYSLQMDPDGSTLVSSGSQAASIKQGKLGQQISQIGYSRSLVYNGTSFIGIGNSSLFSYNTETRETKRLMVLPIRGDNLYIDKKGKLWIGDYTGLYFLQDSALEKAFPENEVLSQRISGIAETEDGKMIVSTIGKGIALIESDKITYIDTKDKLASDIINCLALKGNTIWLGTNNGLCRVILSKDSYEIRNYSVENGLPGNEVSRIAFSKSYVWVITKKFLFFFDPEQIPINKTEPRIWIESANAANWTGPVDGTDKFRYDQFPLKITYIALAYKKRGNIQYRYKLAGLSDDWQYSNSTSVEFLSLPSGNYSFEVYAQNEDGIWNSVPAVYTFSIIPPFWKTWWFIVLIFVCSIAIISIYYYYRLKAMKKKNQMITDILNYRQQALLNQMNPHFIFNSLNSIQTFILTEEKKLATRYISKFARLMRLSLDNSRSEFILLEKEIETMSLYLELEKLRFKEMFSYTMEVASEIPAYKISIPAMLIQPYLENCIKHAFTGRKLKEGKISMNIYMENGKLMCRIEDNGIGREEAFKVRSANAHTHESAGLSITEERLKLICNTLEQEFSFEITDKKDARNMALGTIVIFALPHKQMYDKNSDHR